VNEAVCGVPPSLAPLALCDRELLRRYEIPERGAPGHARFALLPRREDDVGLILRTATAERLPLVIAAGRTGLVEAQRPQGEAVLSLERLNRALALELADGRRYEFSAAADAGALLHWVRQQGAASFLGARLIVQAGIAIDAVNALLEPLGLCWPLEMGSSSAASAGACVANASAGANALCYGTAAHLCDCAWGFWADGSAAGPDAGPRWRLPSAATLAIDSTRVDPDLGLVGSQGLFGVITRLALRLAPLPAAREGVLLPVADMPSAMRFLEAALAEFPGDVEEFEFIGRGALERVCAYLGGSPLPFDRARMKPWCVLLQVKAMGTEAGAALAERLYAFLAAQGVADEDLGYAPLPRLKRIRHAITEASNARARELGGGRLAFDTAVPRARCGEYLDRLAFELARAAPHTELLAFGHAGVGGAHLHLLGTPAQPIGPRAQELIRLVFDLTADHGGTFSAEHGVGAKWATEFRRRADRALVARLREAKRRRDPAWILNPRSFGLRD
jgi:FAD/FMN-containing dehydrogenase